MTTNFARLDTLQDMFREFEAHGVMTTAAKQVADEARRQYEVKQEYYNLQQDYQDLFSKMLQKMLKASTKTEMENLRKYFDNKVQPLIQKLTVLETKISGTENTQVQTSRSEVERKMAEVTSLFDKVKGIVNAQTQKEVKPLVPESVIVPG